MTLTRTVPAERSGELRQCWFGRLLFSLYRVRLMRRVCIRLTLKFEGGHYYSATLRHIFSHYHKVVVGAYSYGDCFEPDVLPPGSQVGRYVSIASALRVFARNHPTTWLSMHPFFYNAQLGIVPHDLIPIGKLWIGDDAWIGDRVTITPGCSRIGIGAVVGAGSVVTRDVPDFAVVAGNPTRLIRFRFPENTRNAIIGSQWWSLPVSDCARHLPEMTTPIDSNHPLLRDICRTTTDTVTRGI
jgi:acetyltransferase-like isoleucine patch superfamily enzyme